MGAMTRVRCVAGASRRYANEDVSEEIFRRNDFSPGIVRLFRLGRLSVGGTARRRDRVTSAQLLRFKPSHFQHVRQRGVILRRRHLRHLRRHCGNIVGDVTIGLAALISHEFCSRSKPRTHHATSMAQARGLGKHIEFHDPSISQCPASISASEAPPGTYRDNARETASTASDAGMNSLSGWFGNGSNPKAR